MPIYVYSALKNGKDFVSGKIEANNVKEARQLLSNKHLLPLNLEEQGEVKHKYNYKKSLHIGNLSMREKIDFTNTLSMLLKTGISIVEALMFMQTNTNSKKVMVLAEELRKDIIGGMTISEAIDNYPKIFDKTFSGLIKAGEEAGELDVTLDRMIELLNKQAGFKAKIISTMMYPVIVILIAVVVVTVMLTFVFPAFTDIYDGLGSNLPAITSFFMGVGTFLKEYFIVVPIVFSLVAYGLYFSFNWTPSRKAIDDFTLNVPLVKEFVKLSSLANFLAVLKVAFDAGIPVTDAIQLSNVTTSNLIIKERLAVAVGKIQQGQNISNSLKAANIIPGIVMCMISTGEQSGQLGDMLAQASDYTDKQLDTIADLLSRMFEPILLVVLGGIVLTMALALYLPLFQAYGNMG